MSQTDHAATSVNAGYTPSEREESVLGVLQRGRKEDEPWGYTTPTVAADLLDSRKQYMSDALGNLARAGWVERISHGVYRFVEDPRE